MCSEKSPSGISSKLAHLFGFSFSRSNDFRAFNPSDESVSLGQFPGVSFLRPHSHGFGGTTNSGGHTYMLDHFFQLCPDNLWEFAVPTSKAPRSPTSSMTTSRPLTADTEKRFHFPRLAEALRKSFNPGIAEMSSERTIGGTSRCGSLYSTDKTSSGTLRGIIYKDSLIRRFALPLISAS